MKRLFTALRFSDRTIRQLAEIQNQLRELNPKARFVRSPEMFHITLFYIGETPKIQESADALAESCRNYRERFNHPISVEFTELGIFKKRRNNIIYLGVKNNEEMIYLSREIQEELRKNDVSIKFSSHFTPHITLLRNGKPDLINTRIAVPDPVRIDKAALVWSHQNQENLLTYDNLEFFSL